VERERIKTEGLGETHLAVQTGEGVREPRNRRVVVRLIEAPGTARDDRDDGRAPR
jgi:outer membrane protein OmpA-like peptidoglycan-associated protein